MEKFWLKIRRLISHQKIDEAINEIESYHVHGLIDATQILEYLKSGQLDIALAKIENKSALIQGDDQLLNEGLKTKIHMAEIELSVLHTQIATIRSAILNYHRRHYEVLHETISRLLFLRKEIAFLKMERDVIGQTEFEERENEFKEYHEEAAQNCLHQENQLSEDENKELNRLYRKAVKLCHPDLLANSQKEMAEKIFILLKNAFERYDLEKVSEICSQLEKGEFGLHPEEQNAEINKLKSFYAKLKTEITEKSNELKLLQNSTVYRTLKFIPDIEAHFDYLKARFTEEIKSLEKEFNDLSA